MSTSGDSVRTIRAALHPDALDSIRRLTGAGPGGIPVEEWYNYTAFGSPYAAEDGNRSLTTYAFTGQFRDATLGMQYHRARWARVATGAWVSADPVFDFLGNFGNRHSYCANNPVFYLDHSGETTSLLELMITAAIYGALFGAAWGLGIGAWDEFVVNPNNGKSLLSKLGSVLSQMFVEAAKGSIYGAAAGPVLGIFVTLARPLLNIVMKFGATHLLNVLKKVFTGPAFMRFYWSTMGRLSHLGSKKGMELFLGKIAELFGARSSQAMMQRGQRSLTNIILTAGGRKAEYDIIYIGRSRVVQIVEAKLTRAGFKGTLTKIGQDYARKVMVANANGLSGSRWVFYIWRPMSQRQIANLTRTLQRNGIGNPEFIQGPWPIIKDIIKNVF